MCVPYILLLLVFSFGWSDSATVRDHGVISETQPTGLSKLISTITAPVGRIINSLMNGNTTTESPPQPQGFTNLIQSFSTPLSQIFDTFMNRNSSLNESTWNNTSGIQESTTDDLAYQPAPKPTIDYSNRKPVQEEKIKKVNAFVLCVVNDGYNCGQELGEFDISKHLGPPPDDNDKNRNNSLSNLNEIKADEQNVNITTGESVIETTEGKQENSTYEEKHSDETTEGKQENSTYEEKHSDETTEGKQENSTYEENGNAKQEEGGNETTEENQRNTNIPKESSIKTTERKQTNNFTTEEYENESTSISNENTSKPPQTASERKMSMSLKGSKKVQFEFRDPLQSTTQLVSGSLPHQQTEHVPWLTANTPAETDIAQSGMESTAEFIPSESLTERDENVKQTLSSRYPNLPLESSTKQLSFNSFSTQVPQNHYTEPIIKYSDVVNYQYKTESSGNYNPEIIFMTSESTKTTRSVSENNTEESKQSDEHNKYRDNTTETASNNSENGSTTKMNGGKQQGDSNVHEKSKNYEKTNNSNKNIPNKEDAGKDKQSNSESNEEDADKESNEDKSKTTDGDNTTEDNSENDDKTTDSDSFELDNIDKEIDDALNSEINDEEKSSSDVDDSEENKKGDKEKPHEEKETEKTTGEESDDIMETSSSYQVLNTTNSFSAEKIPIIVHTNPYYPTTASQLQEHDPSNSLPTSTEISVVTQVSVKMDRKLETVKEEKTSRHNKSKKYFNSQLESTKDFIPGYNY